MLLNMLGLVYGIYTILNSCGNYYIILIVMYTACLIVCSQNMYILKIPNHKITSFYYIVFLLVLGTGIASITTMIEINGKSYCGFYWCHPQIKMNEFKTSGQSATIERACITYQSNFTSDQIEPQIANYLIAFVRDYAAQIGVREEDFKYSFFILKV